MAKHLANTFLARAFLELYTESWQNGKTLRQIIMAAVAHTEKYIWI